jgi:hypothetical protein
MPPTAASTYLQMDQVPMTLLPSPQQQ